MDLYHIVLFLHILTLVVAASASALVEFTLARRRRARTLGEVLDWHGVLMATSKAFPICLVAFVVTGGYMLSVTHLAMTTGFVVAGLVGVLLLLTSGVFLGLKGKALMQVLQGMAAKGGLDQPAPMLAPPPFVAALPPTNIGIAIGVAFAMVTKLTSIPGALTSVALCMMLGAAIGMRRRAPAVERASAT